MTFALATKSLSGTIRTIVAGILMGALVIITGCTKSTDALDTSTNTVIAGEGKLRQPRQVDESKDKSGAKIIRQKSTFGRKGTNIRVLVNNVPITNYDIKKRASFLRLRRVGGNRTQKATEELIEDKLKLIESAKLRTLASDGAVDKAFADFAKRNKMSPKRMAGVLNQAGVSARHFKEFLRVQISWQRTVSGKFRNNARGLSQSDALFSLRKSGEAKPETREYKLQQIIFVVPKAKRKKLLGLRKNEAKSFGQRFISCQDTLSQIKNLRDVSLKELGRILEPELPPRWRDDVIGTKEGKTTRPKETERGVELIAICAVRNISDDRAAQMVTQSKEFDSLNKQGNKAANEYLTELRSKATIIYR